MTIKASGTISLLDIVDEFGGDPPHALTEYYRGGGRVPDIPQNSLIPTSGTISLIDFYGAVNEIVRTITTGGLKATFGAFWRQNIPKRAIINGGVTRALLTIESGMKGTLVIDNYGEIQGYGGSEGRKGGDAVIAYSDNITINNHGAIRGGGGGGGRGGKGGQGKYAITLRDPGAGDHYVQGRWGYFSFVTQHRREGVLMWNGTTLARSPGLFNSTSYTKGGWTYRRGNVRSGTRPPQFGIYRTKGGTNYTNGGAGGRGGRGQGYGQGKQNGLSGRNGGRNAGRGGAGGNGGGWAQTGIRGRTGANGNSGGASQGAYGGSAGWAVQKNGRSVTINNHGTINGISMDSSSLYYALH